MDSDRLSKAVADLTDLVARLRGPAGCPWDARQTDATIKTYLIEEAYEVLEAVEQSKPSEICRELGDLLFQILFLAQLAEERREFNFIDVLEQIKEKMIRRHPHVFGRRKVDSPEEVAANWNKIKQSENGAAGGNSSLLQSVPGRLPALMRTHRLTERAAKAGLDWETGPELWPRIINAMQDLEEAVLQAQRSEIQGKLGKLLFDLADLARHWKLNGEDLLRAANQDFLQDFEAMEKILRKSGIPLQKATSEQIRQAWQKAGPTEE